MLEQCQTRVTARHPGFGRKLVPYFNDNDDDGSTANGIRHQQQKGYFFQLSLEFHVELSRETCGYSRTGQKAGPGFKRSPRSSRKTNYANSRRSKKLDSTSVGFYRFHENKGGSSSPTATMSSNSSGCYDDYTKGGIDFSPPSLCSLFAGPICFNSPPPEALPMPTAVLLAKAMCLS